MNDLDDLNSKYKSSVIINCYVWDDNIFIYKKVLLPLDRQILIWEHKFIEIYHIFIF